MPCLTISTNVSLRGDISSILSQIYVMVSLEGSVPISFGGTEEPAAYAELVSIGALNPQINNKLIAEIASLLETNSSVPMSRFFLKFYDIEGYNCRLNGSIMMIESK